VREGEKERRRRKYNGWKEKAIVCDRETEKERDGQRLVK
jgi:hypothetical protein